MAISHANHDHPNTPAARAACRRRQILAGGGDGAHAKDGTWIQDTQGRPGSGAKRAAQVNVVSRKRGDGGVVKAAAAAVKAHKKPGTPLRDIGDLPDVPRMLAHAARIAWSKAWVVVVGDRFNETEARIVVYGPKAEISLIWRVSLPHGVWGISVRPFDSSVAHKVGDVDSAFRMAEGTMPIGG